MSKVLIIMNPNAGTKAARPFLTDIVEQFCKNGDVVTVMITEKRGDAVDFAQKFGGDCDKVVAVGGDGTLSEVVNGILFGSHNTPIGYIPSGSTNDFAQSLNIPRNLKKAAYIAANGEPHILDAGVFNNRYFTYVASFGAFTKVAYSAPQDLKNILGRLAYFLEGIKDLSAIKPIDMRLETDEGVYEGSYIFGAFSNSTSVAGLLTYDKEIVNLNDGKFELLLIRFPKTLFELNDIIVSLLSKKYSHPSITFASATVGRFTTSCDVDWTLDGEQAEGLETNEISIKHRAISIIL